MPTPSAPPLEPEEEDIHIIMLPCSQCSYETNTNVELNHHNETQHDARQKDYRGIVATKYPIGHAQLAINRNINNVEHKCSECQSVFTVESMLNAHMNNTHNVNYRHDCSQCSKVFNTKEDAAEHMKNSHSGGFSIETAMHKMSEQLSTISERVQSLEQSSLTNFPNLGPNLRHK